MKAAAQKAAGALTRKPDPIDAIKISVQVGRINDAFVFVPSAGRNALVSLTTPSHEGHKRECEYQLRKALDMLLP